MLIKKKAFLRLDFITAFILFASKWMSKAHLDVATMTHPALKKMSQIYQTARASPVRSLLQTIKSRSGLCMDKNSDLLLVKHLFA